MLGKGLAAGVALAIALAGTASADTFCVHHAGCPAANHNFATIQDAVDAAGNNNSPSATKDRILVGPGTYSSVSSGKTSVIEDQLGNPVEIAGSGPGSVIAWPASNDNNKTVVNVGDPASEIHDATIRMPVGSHDFGVSNTGTLTRVALFAPGLESMGQGVFGGKFIDGTVSVPGTDIGIIAATLVQRSDITANIGYDAGVFSGSASLEDSVVHATGPNAVAIRNGGGLSTSTVNVRQVDLIGDGSAGSTAVEVTTGASTFVSTSQTVDVRSSIVRGFAENFHRFGSEQCPPAQTCPPSPAIENSASIAVAYSDVQPAPTPDTDAGPGSLNTTSPGGNTTADPGFVSPTNLHLRHDSALIDNGDPASPASTESQSDRAGLPRKVDGNGDAIARADIGAFEYQRLAPRVFAKAHPTAVKKKKPVTFTATIVDDPGDTIASYKWKFDDGTTATGKTVHHRFKHAGIHRGTLTVTDVTGRKGSGGAKVFVGPVKILSVSLSPNPFKAGHKTTIAYDLSASAPIAIAISRCNSAGAKCKHKVGQLTTTGHAGRNKVQWNGRIGSSPLAPGHYRAVVIAGTGSVKSRSQSLPFQILSG